MRSSRMLGAGLALAVIVLGLGGSQARAAGPAGDPRDKFLSGSTVVIPAGETIPHDLYVAGNSIHIDGRIDGDLFVAGNTVDVTGPVSGDLFVAGGTVTVAAPVGRHLRAAGGTVTVSGPVTLDLMAAAGTLSLTSAARVGGDLIFYGATATMDGTVAGSVLGSAQTYQQTGNVGGSEQVSIRPRNAPRPAPSAGSRVLNQLRRYAGMLIAGALLILLLPSFIRATTARLRQRPLPSLGIGALASVIYLAVMLGLLLAMAILAVLLGLLGLGSLVFTAIGGALLAMGALSYLIILVALLGAAVVVGLTLGRMILEHVEQPWAQSPYVALLLGVLIVVVLTAIPVLGGILDALVFLLGLGALSFQVFQWRGPQAKADWPPAGGVKEPSPLA
jgi:cytoskeletal protein CcmA (bactofilin family)